METGGPAEIEQKAIGLLASLRQMFGTVLDIVRTRIEIVANEVEEEREHLRATVIFGLLALFFLAIGLLLATLFVILLYWDEHRLVVVAAFAALYLALGIASVWTLRVRLRQRSRFLAATLAELREDRERLRP